MNAPPVLRAECDASGYRSAVATIIENIEQATSASLLDIAESIDASRDTVSDAKYGKTSLNPVHLVRLGQVYGAGFLNPYLALFGAQAAPIEPKHGVDVLPAFTLVSAKIAHARSEASMGGKAEVPQEKAEYLPDLKAALRDGAHLVREIERTLA